jgi:hypothetical protein
VDQQAANDENYFAHLTFGQIWTKVGVKIWETKALGEHCHHVRLQGVVKRIAKIRANAISAK